MEVIITPDPLRIIAHITMVILITRITFGQIWE
jgi:hypothetical protein